MSDPKITPESDPAHRGDPAGTEANRDNVNGVPAIPETADDKALREQRSAGKKAVKAADEAAADDTEIVYVDADGKPARVIRSDYGKLGI